MRFPIACQSPTPWWVRFRVLQDSTLQAVETAPDEPACVSGPGGAGAGRQASAAVGLPTGHCVREGGRLAAGPTGAISIASQFL